MCDLVDFVDRHLRGSNGFALTNKTKKRQRKMKDIQKIRKRKLIQEIRKEI